jgi:23S rRNA (adenine2503-C2)-methyltransferase
MAGNAHATLDRMLTARNNPRVPALTDYNVSSLEGQLTQWGLRTSHARRLLGAFYRNADEIDLDSLELGKILRSKFDHELKIRQSRILTRSVGDDGTIKLLVGFDAGGSVESVYMPAYRADRAAGCISSQIGCAMGCDFCASTKNGVERSLSAGEIVEQFLHLTALARHDNRRLASLVFMGMGEPMLNLDNVLAAIERIAHPTMGNLGWKAITVSTVGIVSGIERLAQERLKVSLALSLHAPDDETRAKIVPTNRKWRVAEIMSAAEEYARITDTIATIEYCMLAGVNDSDEQAHMLADQMEGFRAHVNLIPYNAIGAGISGTSYEKPPQERMEIFAQILRSRGIITHFRRTRGNDVNAACGQLKQQLIPIGGLVP